MRRREEEQAGPLPSQSQTAPADVLSSVEEGGEDLRTSRDESGGLHVVQLVRSFRRQW